MPLIDFEINVILNWSANCVILSGTAANQATTFLITDTKLYVPIVYLLTQEYAKLLRHLKSRFDAQLTGIEINQKQQYRDKTNI